MSKCIRIQTEKGSAFQEERVNKLKKKAQNKNKSSKKRNMQKTTSSSESDDSEPEAHPQKRRCQPDPEEIEVDDHPDGEPEVVNVDDREDEDHEPGVVEDGHASEPEAEKNDSLKEHHRAEIPERQKSKKDMTKDLRTVFTERVKVTFTRKGGMRETKDGCWCEECRKDPDIKSIDKAFLTGSNTMCRGHIRSHHYEFYSKKCKEKGIEEVERCIPAEVLRARHDSRQSKTLTQSKLNLTAESVPKEFSREAIIHATTMLVACNNLTFEFSNKPAYHNCLVTMRPHTIKSDLPSDHEVRKCLQNEFARHLNELKAKIMNLPGKASITVDCWTADTTKAGFISITAHWINVAKNGEWELESNVIALRGLSGDHDVIATIRTLAIKIQASGTRIAKFNELQIQSGIQKALKIPLHSNIRWGSAFYMLDRALALQNAITLFINCADRLFRPITSIRQGGRVEKEIPWTAFSLSAEDWGHVSDARDILADSNRIQEAFSFEKEATLWKSLPLIEDLQTRWEKKRDGKAGFERFSTYRLAIQDGLNKLRKYYSKFDEKPAYILALMLHPYYKLDYIQLAWGGEKEQEEERLAGNFAAKNWQDEALRIFEQTVETYWKSHPEEVNDAPHARPSTSTNQADDSIVSDFDRHCLSQLKNGNNLDTWGAEVRHYLKTMEADVTKKTDIIKWWQDHARTYPTLARIALDVLPCQASSVPCERLFSSSKQVAMERRSSLGADLLEQLLVMKSIWQRDIVDWSVVNSGMVEEVHVKEYGDMLQADEEAKEWEVEDLEQFIFDSDRD
ncbi:hypothetical protein AX14_001593 [Amanita brunnescens Koide BX004]|nr:hypothetical protein AX14_001593 [Amanita brunnescens Koide BX004]